MSEEEQPQQFVWKVGRPHCILCNEGIEHGVARAALLMFASDDEIVTYQLDAHLECLRKVAHPAMAERVDPAFFERYKESRGWTDHRPDH
jgi:hypothetical protein